jgi:uncharacterized protein YoxC
VMGVDDRVKGVEGKMQDVRDDVQGVDNKVQDVDDRVQDISPSESKASMTSWTRPTVRYFFNTFSSFRRLKQHHREPAQR